MPYGFNKEKFKGEIIDHIRNFSRKTLEDASPQEIYQAVAFAVRDVITDDWIETQRAYTNNSSKILYYLSMEFLVGRALGNNLVNMGILEDVIGRRLEPRRRAPSAVTRTSSSRRMPPKS